jgi:hypothetical protein
MLAHSPGARTCPFRLTQEWKKNALFSQAKVHSDALAAATTKRDPGQAPLSSFSAWQETLGMELFRILPVAWIMVHVVDVKG